MAISVSPRKVCVYTRVFAPGSECLYQGVCDREFVPGSRFKAYLSGKNVDYVKCRHNAVDYGNGFWEGLLEFSVAFGHFP